jgi:hypothetical protein
MTAIEIETEAKTKNGKRKLSREDKERIKRAAEEKIEIGGHIERLNAKHAVVNLAGDVVILTEHAGQPPTFNNPAALHLWYANDLVSNGQQMVPVSQMWLRSKKRRQYDRVVFDPRDDNPRLQPVARIRREARPDQVVRAVPRARQVQHLLG